MVFIADSPAYRSCCCHARTCTIVIGVLEIIGLLGQLIGLIVGYATLDQARPNDVIVVNGTDVLTYLGPSPVSMAFSVIGFVVGVIVVILLFVGIAKENHKFLIPHLISQIIGIVSLAIWVIVSIVFAAIAGVALAAASSAGDQRAAHIGGLSVVAFVILTVIIIGIAIGLQIWFFIVVLKCYRFFRDQRAAKEVMVYNAVNPSDAQQQPAYYKSIS